MAALGLIIGILGLLATIFGTYIAYETYISPMTRFKKFLKRPNNWEVVSKNDSSDIYRYKTQPGYQLTIDWSKPIVHGFKEPWIRRYPDENNNTSYHVVLEANGVFLNKELFVTLDGGRGFVPVPKAKSRSKILDFDSKEPLFYYYTRLQIQLARIVSRFPYEKTIEDFADKQEQKIVLDES